ncbi:MAG: cation diffusion facilitator family transporter [SAR324 cluster bacterium]|nr:cation diffusion facilitator family transporter [SAR324 cluster bacterium]
MDKNLDFSNYKVLGVVWLGVIANLGLALLKGIIGVIANSSAMVADAAHSLSDLLSDGVTLWAIYMTKKPKDHDHPYGHGKFETIGTLFVAILLGFAGVGIAFHSLQFVESPSPPGTLALWAAIGSILIKEGMYHITAAVGKRAGSRILVANAWHHRSDAFSSVVALIGIGASQLGYPILDPIAGVLVAGLIIKAGIEMGRESTRELADEMAEDDILETLDTIMKEIDGFEHYHQARARKMGPYTLMDMHLEVPSTISVSVAHQISERVRQSILTNIPAVNEVLIHIDAEPDTEEIYQTLMRPLAEVENDIREALSTVPEIQGISHILCHYLRQKIMVQIEITVDPDLLVAEAKQIAARAKQLVEAVKDIGTADIHLELETH